MVQTAQSNLAEFEISERNLLFAYYLATTNVFELERSRERLAWTKTTTLMEAVASYFENEATSIEQRIAFLREFKNSGSHLDYVNGL